ncbi:MAG: RraA family protein [Deinococcota bacterium]|jgi:4-hydroxy-4-methyl-2-oxoglutarate aldolase|nr:RraA family protein [Deinococcota bacterium]
MSNKHSNGITPDHFASFKQFDPATLYEANNKQGMIDPLIKVAWPGAALCGPAFTVECAPGDNLMLHKAVTLASPGDVLVATTNHYVRAGAWGEVLTVAAQSKNIAGLAIDGAVRDITAIQGLRFPIFSRGLAIGSCSKSEAGTVGEPINFGGVRVRTGDLILGDGDGLVVIAKQRINEVLRAAFARQEKEQHMMNELKQGKTTVELLELGPVLTELDKKGK